MNEERDELVMGLLELADQLQGCRPPIERRARWEWEPPALTPRELRRVAELLESGE